MLYLYINFKQNNIMKKIMLAAVIAVITMVSVNAQSDNSGQTSKGKWLIEANTGSMATGNTAFTLTSVDGSTYWSAGVDAGYFMMDDLALKVGLGYSDFGGGINNFVYKVGAKYYFNSQIPVGVDFTGTSSDGDNANWVGLQAGYAWFLGSNVAIEPTLRYNITLDELKAPSAFQALIGFSLFF